MINRLDDLDTVWNNFMSEGILNLTKTIDNSTYGNIINKELLNNNTNHIHSNHINKNSNDIDANDIDANNIDANNIDANNIDANNIDANGIDNNDIDNNDINGNDIDSNGNINNYTCYSNNIIPKTSEIYISTKTKISYLNKCVDLKETFWNIGVIKYGDLCEGVVKKQMKFNSIDKDTVYNINEKIKEYELVNTNIIQQIDNPNGRVKFKDIRKISIGICKKDLLTYRTKQKSAFYNCFVLILRININKNDKNNKIALFKEFHVKVFNTGKLEIPGIKTDEELKMVLDLLVKIINQYNNYEINYDNSKSETVLINSNFNSNYYINREKLFQIMKYKYKIQAVFDPCSYPGIQSKIFFDDTGVYSEEKCDIKMKSISFMIFRTGSVLIVGKCEENDLYNVYNYLKQILYDEYHEIKDNNMDYNKKEVKIKNRKIKKKMIYVDE